MPDEEGGIFRSVFEATDAGLVLVDREYCVIRWNAAFSVMSGISAEVGATRSLEDVFPGADLRRLRRAVDESFEFGAARLLTHTLNPQLLPLRTRAGRNLIHDVTVSLASRDPEACLIQITDVTVAVTREGVLRERQNARYAAVVDSAVDAILTFDSEGIIQLVNPAARRQFGYTSKDLVGKKIDILFADQEAWTKARDAVLSDKALRQPVPLVGLRKDGSPSRLELTLSRWQSEKWSFVTALLRDANERYAIEEARKMTALALADLNATLEQKVADRTAQLVQAEEALRQSAKMEAIGQLTGGIAHDFNNLLQGIIGALDLIKRRIAARRFSEVDRFVEGATSSANRAAALTHRLLAFSRRQPVDPRSLDMNELISSVEELVRRSIGEGIETKVVKQPGLWLVRCDGHQLENALLNLSINARDALPDGGTLTIETANVALGAAEAKRWNVASGDYVALRVKDTGVGMPPEVKARAFDPFFTTKPIGQGTGLGLSMIHGFVHQSGGSIQIDSAVGRGTTIELLLPRFRGAVDEIDVRENAANNHSAGPNEVVLVVEDEAEVGFLVVDVLKDLGYQTLEVVDGAKALEILLSPQRIDLLVTDIGLPGINGRQLADAARERRPDLKVLFMTGYAENAASSAFLGPGMEILVKPVSMDALSARVGGMLGTKPRA